MPRLGGHRDKKRLNLGNSDDDLRGNFPNQSAQNPYAPTIFPSATIFWSQLEAELGPSTSHLRRIGAVVSISHETKHGVILRNATSSVHQNFIVRRCGFKSFVAAARLGSAVASFRCYNNIISR